MASPMYRTFEIIQQPISALKPYPRNARRHARKQIRQIAASIQEFGFCSPILTDEMGEVIAGHGRLEAARELGLETVPTITIAGLDDRQKAALRLADNKIPENATRDLELLTRELEFIGASVDFDVTITGFETAEIDLMLRAGSERDERADAVPMLDPSRPVTMLGDRWLLGPCADHILVASLLTCRDRMATAALLRHRKLVPLLMLLILLNNAALLA